MIPVLAKAGFRSCLAGVLPRAAQGDHLRIVRGRSLRRARDRVFGGHPPAEGPVSVLPLIASVAKGRGAPCPHHLQGRHVLKSALRTVEARTVEARPVARVL
eukprot:scaffold3474_cov246-Pinguiococcus_pyrenoidosus.AAC.10